MPNSNFNLDRMAIQTRIKKKIKSKAKSILPLEYNLSKKQIGLQLRHSMYVHIANRSRYIYRKINLAIK